MRTLIVIAMLALSSCATTTFYRDGKAVARFSGDMTNMVYADGDIKWVAGSVNHSDIVKAHSAALTGGIAAAGAAATLLK